MAVVEANKAPVRGGHRPGAGRPALPEGERKERIVLYVRPGAAAARRGTRLSDELYNIVAYY